MRRFPGVLAAGVLICGLSVAQSTENPPKPQGTQQAAPQTGSLRIAPGSVIPVQLAKTVDAKKVKTGDQVVAKVTQDLKNQTGEILVPKDTEVVGHVTEAQARSKQEKESELGIAFDHAVVKGENVNIPMSIQAVIGQQNSPETASSGSAPEQPAGPPSAGGGMPPNGGRSMGQG
jgi:hypothetical protein